MAIVSDPYSTKVNHDQQQQGELKPLLGVVRSRLEEVDYNLVARCKDEHEALLLCVHLSRLSQEEVCRQLGIDKGHFSRILQGRGNLPERKRTQLMSICGNIAPLQYQAMRVGRKLIEHDVAREEQELLERLARVQAQKRVMEMAA